MQSLLGKSFWIAKAGEVKVALARAIASQPCWDGLPSPVINHSLHSLFLDH